MNKGRKISGGKYHSNRKKRFFEKARDTRNTSLGDVKTKVLRTKGGNNKKVLLKSNIVNLTTEKGKTKKVEIKNVISTPQNQFFARQNRLMKGVIIDTPLGKAKITNRPSQEGHINAVLIK